ncbi:FdtA/QdtA family cupin domain-containing protein [Acidovorax sp. sif1233]|nr:FdtA/QdtA family cupin domain-containing protein [Acidovorax sp. sif0732]MBV7450161.1 FdtA/QdtA family cupin domain-containing protein [Acidovorax sp. sif0715]MBV7455238.1 FdtA/QdtA family cupin domain-containing protein [Acidovorax sp. sif1233]
MNTIAPNLCSSWFGGRVRFIDLPTHTDERGNLLPLDFDSLPFTPRRAFTVTDAPTGSIRGEHGHRSGEQLLICLHGKIGLLLRKGHEEVDTVLTPAGPGLLLGAGVWCRQTYLVSDSSLLVLASEPYDPGSYVSTWN